MSLVTAVTVVLLVLPWVVALALARHHHLDATAVGILAALSIPLAGLWLAWVTLAKSEPSDASAKDLSVPRLADQLAVVVRKQWADEAALRRLNDPYPLPVSWTAADASFTDPWDSLLRLRTTGAGWPPLPPPGTWAAGPDDLAGKGGELVEVLAKVPTARLVVLGGPGKTMLMIRLVLDLLSRRAEGGPVPVLASLASWDPAGQDLSNWLAAQLIIDHPALAAAAPPETGGGNRIQALLTAGLILPVLDGLDEIPGPARGRALASIIDALRPGVPLVVTCRDEQYRDVVRPPSGPSATLPGAAAIQLCPLDPVDVNSYLRDTAGPGAEDRWDPVLAVLGTQTPVGQVLATPLMVGLARAIYSPRPGEYAGDLRDPAELCNTALADQAAVEALLFDAFIPAAYRSPIASRWRARQAETWLVFLARHLEGSIGSPDLAWWQLRRATSRPAFGVAVLLAAVLALWLGAAVVGGSLFALVFGLPLGLLAGFGTAKVPARGVRIRARGLLAGVAIGIVTGFWAGQAANSEHLIGAEVEPRPEVAVGVGLSIALAAGLVFGLMFGLAGVPRDIAGVTSPQTVLARDRQVALLFLISGGLMFGLVFGLVFGFGVGPAAGYLFGLVYGFAGGYGLSAHRAAWPSYMLTRGWLALRHRLPWPLMSFLDDAHRRGVLRQAGAVYQFRHIELQHRLANRDADSS